MQSLFPTQAGGGAGGGGNTLNQFKAGKCEMEEIPEQTGKYRVTPNKKKGLLSLFLQDGLVKVRWTDRGTNSVADEFIVMPEEVTLKKINTGREGDRVYLLKWNNVNRKHMYWMQDKKPDKDDENITKFNDFARNPNQPAPNRYILILLFA